MATDQNAAAEAVGAAPKNGEKQPTTENGAGGDKLAAWSGFSLILGLAGDMATPVGQYSLWFAIAGIAALVICFLLRRIRFARRAMFHSGVFAAIMSAIVALQYLSPPEKDAEERGIAAAFVPALASIQTKVLPLPENQRLLLQFQNAIGSGGDSERLASARELYEGTEDKALRRGMLDAMLQSDNAALQQGAILMQMAERRGDRLTLVPSSRDATDILSRRLLSYSFKVSRVDVDSGALDLLGDGFGSDGTVSRRGITMQLYIDDVPEGRKLMFVELAPGKDMQLTGTARLDSGETAAVEMPLF